MIILDPACFFKSEAGGQVLNIFVNILYNKGCVSLLQFNRPRFQAVKAERGRCGRRPCWALYICYENGEKRTKVFSQFIREPLLDTVDGVNYGLLKAEVLHSEHTLSFRTVVDGVTGNLLRARVTLRDSFNFSTA